MKLELFIAPLSRHLNRETFCCGEPALDSYLKTRAMKELENHVSTVFVLTNGKDILGYYTLSAIGIHLSDLPNNLAKKLPHYHDIPAVLLGRLAVDLNYQKQSIGEFLLVDALKRAFSSSSIIGAIAVIVDSKHEKIVPFYKKYGFHCFRSNPLRLFIPMKSIQSLFEL